MTTTPYWAGWGNGNWNIEAFAFNPSVGNYRSTSMLTDIGPYSSWSETYSSSYHRQFGLSVRYSFSYGKKVQQGEKLGPVQGAESGCLTQPTDEIQTHTPAGSDAVRRRLVARIWHLSTMTGFTNCKHKKQNSE